MKNKYNSNVNSKFGAFWAIWRVFRQYQPWPSLTTPNISYDHDHSQVEKFLKLRNWESQPYQASTMTTPNINHDHCKHQSWPPPTTSNIPQEENIQPLLWNFYVKFYSNFYVKDIYYGFYLSTYALQKIRCFFPLCKGFFTFFLLKWNLNSSRLGKIFGKIKSNWKFSNIS